MPPEESPHAEPPKSEPAAAFERLPFDHDEPTPAAVIAAAQAQSQAQAQPIPSWQDPPAQPLPLSPLPVPSAPPAGPYGGYPPSWAGAGSGAYPQPLPLQPMPPPPPKRRWGRIIALVSFILIVCCAASVAVAVFGLPQLRSTAEPKPSASPTPARSPESGDPESVARAWIRERIHEALTRQASALLDGDEAAYLAVAPRAGKHLRDQLRRQFRSLRAMQVASWTDEFRQPPLVKGEEWTAELVSYPCFVTAPCDKAAAPSSTRWRMEEGAAVLVSWDLGTVGETPHPWQVSALKARSGERTIVATTAKYAAKLPFLVKQAEAAAVVADRFARGGDQTPTRYVIYYAGPTEWRTWFDWDPPEWSAGVAIRVSIDRHELVLNAKVLTDRTVDELLRHELTHAATLRGTTRDSENMWWLLEGIAELAEMDGLPASRHPSLANVRKLLDTDKVKSLAIDPPKSKTEDWIVDASYGMAFLGSRCIADRHGEQQFVELFYRVVHDGLTLTAAAEEVLDVEWQALSEECLVEAERVAG